MDFYGIGRTIMDRITHYNDNFAKSMIDMAEYTKRVFDVIEVQVN